MKKTMLLAVSISVLSVAVAFAEDKQPGNEPNKKPEPNQNIAPPAAPAPQQQGFEQIRERARQRILNRIEQGRQQAKQQGGADSNTIAARPGRGDVNMAGGMADANTAKYRKAAIERILSEQEVKYRERLGRLGRIRELAKEQGDANAVGKVDKLIEQDRQLHQAKVQRMSYWQEMMEHQAGRLPGSSGEARMRIDRAKGANIPDANKNASQVPAGKQQ